MGAFDMTFLALRRMRVIFLYMAIIGPVAWAVNFPSPQGRVNDFAGVLDAGTKAALEAIIQEVDQKTTAEIAVVTVQSLEGLTVEDYANRLFQKWGIGKKGKDNGVLLLVAIQDRKMRIEVGYGLEALLPDGLAGEILREQLRPAFKSGNYSKGILDGVHSVAQIIEGKPFDVIPDTQTPAAMGIGETLAMLGFLSIFVGIGFFFVGIGAGSKAIFPMLWGSFFGGIPLLMCFVSASSNVRFLLPLMGIGTLIGGFRTARKHPSWFRNFNQGTRNSSGWVWGGSRGSSGGSSGSSSGGGFSGGSSGGGGASSSW